MAAHHCVVRAMASSSALAPQATKGLAPGSDTKLDAETLDAISDDIPCARLDREAVVDKPLIDVMVLVSSRCRSFMIWSEADGVSSVGRRWC